jgi:hypothetical protein
MNHAEHHIIQRRGANHAENHIVINVAPLLAFNLAYWAVVGGVAMLSQGGMITQTGLIGWTALVAFPQALFIYPQTIMLRLWKSVADEACAWMGVVLWHMHPWVIGGLSWLPLIFLVACYIITK